MTYARYDKNEEPLVISKSVMDLLTNRENACDLISMYLFYYYTAKWQKTNQIKATKPYVMQGLNIGSDRFKKAHNELVSLGLIEDIVAREQDKISGHYIKVNFIWTRGKVNEILENTINRKTYEKENLLVGKQRVNALSTNNINALSADKEKKERKKEGVDNFQHNLISEKSYLSPQTKKDKKIEKIKMSSIDSIEKKKVKRKELTDEEKKVFRIYTKYVHFNANEKTIAVLENVPKALEIFKEFYPNNAFEKFEQAVIKIMNDPYWRREFDKVPVRLSPSIFLNPKWVRSSLVTCLDAGIKKDNLDKQEYKMATLDDFLEGRLK